MKGGSRLLARFLWIGAFIVLLTSSCSMKDLKNGLNAEKRGIRRTYHYSYTDGSGNYHSFTCVEYIGGSVICTED